MLTQGSDRFVWSLVTQPGSVSSPADEEHTGFSTARQWFKVNGPNTPVPAKRTPPLSVLVYVKFAFHASDVPWAGLPRLGTPGEHRRGKLELRQRQFGSAAWALFL